MGIDSIETPVNPGDHVADFGEVQRYLARFGWLTAPFQEATLDEPTVVALDGYQRFFGVDERGEFGEATKRSMLVRRCAHADWGLRVAEAVAEPCRWLDLPRELIYI